MSERTTWERWVRRLAGVAIMIVNLGLLVGAILLASVSGVGVYLALVAKMGHGHAEVCGLLTAVTAYAAGMSGRRLATFWLTDQLVGIPE